MPIKGKTRITTQFAKIPDSFNTEFQFIKQRKKYAKVINASGNRSKGQVTSNSKVKKYEFKNVLDGHSHLIKEEPFFLNKKFKTYLVPSSVDIASIYVGQLSNKANYSHVISIRDQKNKLEAGRVHFMLMPETIKILDGFLKSTSLMSDVELLVQLRKTYSDVHQIKDVMDDPKEKLLHKKHFALKELLAGKILSRKGFNFEDYHISAFEYWTDFLKIKFRFVPNKKEGYYFNPETMEFLKK